MRFDPAGAFQKGQFGSFEELLGAREQGFARMKKLQLFAEGFLGAGSD